MNLRNRIIAALRASGKPLPFEKIYIALEADGHPMPKNKPKLQVRQTLYKKDCFDVQKGGLFYLKDDTISEEPESAAESRAVNGELAEMQPVKIVKTSGGPKLKDRIITILRKFDKPMSFEDIYSALEKDRFPLPKSKPKLQVRQVLYKADYFTAGNGGLFTANEGVEAEPYDHQAVPETAGLPEASTAKNAPAQEAPASTAGVIKLKDRLILILKQAGKPLSFQKIYEALGNDGHPLPKSKPKLQVRQALYSTDFFNVEKGGLFTVVDGVEAEVKSDAASVNIQTDEAPAVGAQEDKSVEIPALSLTDTAQFVERAKEEARIAAREAAAQAREEAIREARESARLAAQEAAAEIAREAALEAAKMAKEAEETKRMAIEAAVAAARSAALEAAREAARIALSETTQAVAAAAAEEAKRISGNQAAVAQQQAADIDPVDQELLDAARAAREAVAQASAAVDNSLGMTIGRPAATQPVNKPNSAVVPVSKGVSIRERTAQAIQGAGRPLSVEEVMTELGKDGYPLPIHNSEKVVQRVLDNVNNFEQIEPGLYTVRLY